VRSARWALTGAACLALSIGRSPTAQVQRPVSPGQVQVAKRVPTDAALRSRQAILTPKTGEEHPLPSLWDTSRPSQSIWEWAAPISAFGVTLGLMVVMLASRPVHAAAAQDQAVMECGLGRDAIAMQQLIHSTMGLLVTCADGVELEHEVPNISGQ